MSKKDRLKAQGEKQLLQRREAEEYEREEREAARLKQSRAAKRLRRKSKRSNPDGEPVIMLILKLLMIVPFAYSGFFWGGVTVVAIKGGRYIDNEPPAWVGYIMLAGIVVMLAGIIFAFYKKYIVSFVLCAAGTVGFFKASQWFVRTIQEQLSTKKVDDSLLNLDKQYMWRYYPIGIMMIFSVALLIFGIVRIVLKKKRIQRERDNAPVDSIVNE